MRIVCFLFVISCWLFLIGCNICNAWGEKPLGNRFALVAAAKDYNSIVFCTSSKCCSVGLPIIDGNVENYAFNSRWIIAKARIKGQNTFWIIDKDFNVEIKPDSGVMNKVLKYVSGPLDSLTFNKLLQERKIDLRF